MGLRSPLPAPPPMHRSPRHPRAPAMSLRRHRRRRPLPRPSRAAPMNGHVSSPEMEAAAPIDRAPPLRRSTGRGRRRSAKILLLRHHLMIGNMCRIVLAFVPSSRLRLFFFFSLEHFLVSLKAPRKEGRKKSDSPMKFLRSSILAIHGYAKKKVRRSFLDILAPSFVLGTSDSWIMSRSCEILGSSCVGLGVRFLCQLVCWNVELGSLHS